MHPHRPSTEEYVRLFHQTVRNADAHHPANQLAIVFAICEQRDDATGNAPLREPECEYYDLGPTSVGKTNLSVALAEAAIQGGFGAYFMTAHDLVADLGRAYR